MGNVDIQVARSAILASELLHSRADLTPSSQLLDWYAPDSSLLFSKNVIEFELSSGGVVVEATEFPPPPLPLSPVPLRSRFHIMPISKLAQVWRRDHDCWPARLSRNRSTLRRQ